MFLLFIHVSYGGQLRQILIQLLIVYSGDIKSGPKIKSQLSVCHFKFNLNGLLAHNFIKVSLLQVLAVIRDYDIICLSETQKQPQEVFCIRKGVLRNFAKFTGKHLCRNLFFNKAAGIRQFPVNFAKFLRTPFLTEHLP